MGTNDEILRAYALLTSLRQNLPGHPEVEERWVREYHEAVTKIEGATKKDLSEFRVSHDSLERLVASSNYLTGEVTYRNGLWCERSVLLQKIDAILTYFTGVQAPDKDKIGFR